MADACKPKPGDWIAFQRDSRIVIGEVRYITGEFSATRVVTDIGDVSVDRILEVRTTP